MPITHAKVTPLPSLTQGQLDDAIAAGQYPAGTTLADIVSNVDWNNAHVFDLAIADITGLQALLNALSNDIAGKANASHSHVISQITGLQDALDALTASLSGKANTSHTHAISDVTGLSTQLSTITSDITALVADLSAIETTANSALQPSAIANMLETSDIGVTVQAHDAQTAKRNTAQTFAETQTFAKAAQGTWGTSTYAATFTLDMSKLGETITLTGNITFNAVSNLTAGDYKKVEVMLVQSGANRTASFNTAVFKKAGASYPTLSTADGSVDYLIVESQPDGTVIVTMKQKGVS